MSSISRLALPRNHLRMLSSHFTFIYTFADRANRRRQETDMSWGGAPLLTIAGFTDLQQQVITFLTIQHALKWAVT